MVKRTKSKKLFLISLIVSISCLFSTNTSVLAANDDYERETAVAVVFEKDQIKAEPIQVESPQKNQISTKKAEQGSSYLLKRQSVLPQTGEKVQIGLILIGIIILLALIVYMYRNQRRQKEI